jgi:hypothetical protein
MSTLQNQVVHSERVGYRTRVTCIRSTSRDVTPGFTVMSTIRWSDAPIYVIVCHANIPISIRILYDTCIYYHGTIDIPYLDFRSLKLTIAATPKAKLECIVGILGYIPFVCLGRHVMPFHSGPYV